MAYFRVTGGGGGTGATITVTYDSSFYNKTITCTKGTKTYTKTTTSSGSTTFKVGEEGTWTITCNGVSRQVDVVLEYTTQMAITTTVTVYSAASDTVSFTDVTGAKTVTTDTDGQGSVSITFIPNSTITFTSSYAKNLSDLTQAYSKTITMTSNTTEVYVMPDETSFWFGYGNYANVESNSWGSVSKLTRSIQAGGTGASGGLRYIRFNLTNPQNTSGKTVCKMYAKVTIPQVYSDGTPNLQWAVVTTPPISGGTTITSLDGVTQIDISSYSDTRYAAFYLCNNSHGTGSISVEIYAVCFE